MSPAASRTRDPWLLGTGWQRRQGPGWGLLPPRSAAEVTFFPSAAAEFPFELDKYAAGSNVNETGAQAAAQKPLSVAAGASGPVLAAGRLQQPQPGEGLDTGGGLPGGGAPLCRPSTALADAMPLPGSNPRVAHRKGLLPAGSSATLCLKYLPPSLGLEKAPPPSALTRVSPPCLLACPQQSPRLSFAPVALRTDLVMRTLP